MPKEKCENIDIIHLIFKKNKKKLTSPLYLKESWTDRSNSQNGHKYSNRNSSIKSADITIAHNIRNLTYKMVLLKLEKKMLKKIIEKMCN